MATPTRKFGICAACHQRFTTATVFRADVTYCCDACAGGQLCTCRAEEDLAEDGVDRISVPFPAEGLPEVVEEVPLVPVG